LENPKYAYGKDTGYYNIELLVISDKGCMDTMTQRVYIGPDIIVFIPDVFSPNGFGPNLNNTFGPVASNFKDFSMLIFNRWGEKMYETRDITKQWNGTYLKQNADPGVYAYYIEISSKDDKVYKFEGTFHLVR
jgi:trimeric autotransporter adhesin